MTQKEMIKVVKALLYAYADKESVEYWEWVAFLNHINKPEPLKGNWLA